MIFATLLTYILGNYVLLNSHNNYLSQIYLIDCNPEIYGIRLTFDLRLGQPLNPSDDDIFLYYDNPINYNIE